MMFRFQIATNRRAEKKFLSSKFVLTYKLWLMVSTLTETVPTKVLFTSILFSVVAKVEESSAAFALAVS